jgi:hypothetical protein
MTRLEKTPNLYVSVALFRYYFAVFGFELIYFKINQIKR